MAKWAALAVATLLPWLWMATEQAHGSAEIIGGEPAERQPYMVHVYSTKGTCGGALVAAEWVITAAHCIADLPLNVVVGDYDTNIADGEMTVAVAEVYEFGFDNSGFYRPDYDIALLHLQFPVTETPIRMGIRPEIGASIELYGWGQQGQTPRDTRLQHGSAQMIEHHETYLVSYGSYSSFGDSGGPAAFDDQMIGVIVAGGGIDGEGWTTIVSIDAFAEQINTIIAEHSWRTIHLPIVAR